VAAGVAVWVRCGPIDEALLARAAAPSTVVVDRHGRVLYEALTEDGARVEPLTAATVPPVLEAATLAAEDRRFYSHPGVDPVSLLRAIKANLSEGRIVEGGSTIAQQTAKLLIQRREGVRPRGVRAKVREMVLALRLEHRLGKRSVLALYLNLASYGNQTAGAARASRLYFGVEPSMLTPAQAAFLAALPQRPTAFNPWKGIDSARTRQQAVLRRMRAAGSLNDERWREARDEQIVLRPRHAPFEAPHFVQMVLGDPGGRGASTSASTSARFASSDGQARPAPAGRIVTTLDRDLQREVAGIVEHLRPSLASHGAANVAVVVLDNRRAEWLAWEGSGDYADAEHGGTINGPSVPRQPGSALKPFTYALAFEQGRSPASVLPDIPSHFATAQAGVLYSPRNYDGQYRGPLLARKALAGSVNIPAVALASDVGLSTLQRFFSRAGITTFDRSPAYYGVGLTLGDAEVRLDELVAAYASFARGGVWLRPTAVLPPSDALPPEGGSHMDAAGGRGFEGESGGFRLQAEERRLVSERTAFWITDILSDPEARAFIFGRGGDLEFPFPVAVKTGTSQAYHDNWTVGYTRDVTVGVWVGNFDRRPLRQSSGVTGAGPIFHAVMLAAARRAGSDAAREILPPPPDLHEETICALSGKRANPWCPTRVKEWVSDVRPAPCDWHERTEDGVVEVYPPEYRAWSGPRVSRTVPEMGAAATPRDARLDIANPPSGAVYSIDPTLRREFQSIPLRAITGRPTTLTWLVDGAPVGTASSERTIAWPLAAGPHDIEVRDSDGRSARASVVVR
jgi:penicillin-binding protein 1C